MACPISQGVHNDANVHLVESSCTVEAARRRATVRLATGTLVADILVTIC